MYKVLLNSLVLNQHVRQRFRPSSVLCEVESESLDSVEAQIEAGQAGDVGERVQVENIVVRKIDGSQLVEAFEIACVEHRQLVV